MFHGKKQLPGLLLLISYQLNTASGTTKTKVRIRFPYQPYATCKQPKEGRLDEGCISTLQMLNRPWYQASPPPSSLYCVY